MNYIIAIGMFQALVAAILLWQNQQKNKADKLLLFLLFCIGAHLSVKFFIYNFITDAHVQYQMNTFIGLCYGPLIYLYALKKKDNNFLAINKWYLFLPFVLAAVGYLTVICVLFTSLDAGHSILGLYNRSTTWFFSFYNLACAILAWRISAQLMTDQAKEKLLIREIAFCLIAVSTVGLLNKFLKAFIPFEDTVFRSICYSLLGIVCVIIIRFKYTGIIQNHPLSKTNEMHPAIPYFSDVQIHNNDSALQVFDEQEEATRKSQLSTEEHVEILQKLDCHLKETEAYTDAELTLDKLARAIHVSRYHLSETLNNYAHKSFYQYINELRINRVKQQMRNMTEKGLSINMLILAYDNGFKAKSSFNLYFKKLTGYTPTEYMKILLTELENNVVS